MKKKKVIGLILMLPLTIYLWTLTLDVFFDDFPVYHLPYSVIVTGATLWLTSFVIDIIRQLRQ